MARQAFEAAYLAAAPLCEDQRALKRALREAAATLLAKLEAAQATTEAPPPAEPSAPDEEARWAARVCKAVVKDMRHSEFCVAWSRRGGRSTTTFARRYRDFEALWKALRSGRLVAFQPLVVPLLPTKVGFGRHVEQSFVAAREAGLRRWLGVVTASPAARAAPCLARFLDPRTGPGTFAHDEAARSPDDDAFEETGAEQPPPGGRRAAFSRLLSEKAALDGAAHAYKRAHDATRALRARVAAAREAHAARALALEALAGALAEAPGERKPRAAARAALAAPFAAAVAGAARAAVAVAADEAHASPLVEGIDDLGQALGFHVDCAARAAAAVAARRRARHGGDRAALDAATASELAGLRRARGVAVAASAGRVARAGARAARSARPAARARHESGEGAPRPDRPRHPPRGVHSNAEQLKIPVGLVN